MARSLDIAQAVKKLRRFYSEHERIPSVDEIRTLFGYRSKNAAFWLIRRLMGEGYLKKDARGRVMLRSLCGARVLGNVQAGFPSPAEEELRDTLDLDRYLIERPEQTFLVRVTGDSMIDAGIREGDLVVVERGRTPAPFDIVVAQVDGEWTMKYYDKTSGKPLLRAANPKYPPIQPARELVIGGVVTAVIRKYK